MIEDELTEKLLNELKDSSNVYSYISKYLTDLPQITFPSLIQLFMQKKKLKKSHVIKRTGLHRTYAYQIMSGSKKPSRDKVLRMAYGLELNLEEAQKLLTVAEFNPLYPKLKRDSVIIYALCNGYTLEKSNFLLYENNEEPID